MAHSMAFYASENKIKLFVVVSWQILKPAWHLSLSLCKMKLFETAPVSRWCDLYFKRGFGYIDWGERAGIWTTLRWNSKMEWMGFWKTQDNHSSQKKAASRFWPFFKNPSSSAYLIPVGGSGPAGKRPSSSGTSEFGLVFILLPHPPPPCAWRLIFWRE